MRSRAHQLLARFNIDSTGSTVFGVNDGFEFVLPDTDVSFVANAVADAVVERHDLTCIFAITIAQIYG